MSDRAADDRRAATLRTTPRPGPARRLVSAVRAGLYRSLAVDDDRAAYWVRHVRNGVLLTEMAAGSVIGYVLLTSSAGSNDPVILALAGLTMVLCPGLLLLPLDGMMRDHRGPTLFYAWSIATTVLVVIATRLDGGASSPLDALLFLTLGFMAGAYSPYGVVAMGTLMSGGHFVFVVLSDPSMSGFFFVTVMLCFTLICAMNSANSWAAYDRQAALMRTQEHLAATDPLTGIPNRRAFLDRVSGAVDDAAGGQPTVVCLVDLDGFKAVNDAGGHAAGDAALQAIAAALSSAVRETDTVARLGGDEFAVLADVSPGFSGEMLAERLREAVARMGGSTGVTASVGLAEVLPGDDVQDLLHRADAAMYRSKSAGGNCVTAQPV